MTEQPSELDLSEHDVSLTHPPEPDAPWAAGTTTAGLDDRVEFAAAGDGVLVRDPRYPEGPHLRFSPEQWTALLTASGAEVIDAREPLTGDVVDLRENTDTPSS